MKIIEPRQHRSSETENNNELTSPTSLDDKSCSSKIPCNELTDPPQNLSSSLLSPEAAVRYDFGNLIEFLLFVLTILVLLL